MLSTSSINELGTNRPDLYAFRIEGRVSQDDMTRMAEHMNKAFDAHDKVDMLLCFENFEGSDMDSGLTLENAKTQLRALQSVRRYVVVNAPKQASDLVEAMGKILPVKAESFDSLDAAMDDLNATAMTTA